MGSFAKASAGLPLALLFGLPAAAAPDAGFAPLAFLAGHCWKGTFSDGKTTDEHCFSWIYHGWFMRDRHVVRSPGAPDGFGESIYVWDAEAQQLRYLYIESGGGFSRGTVAAEGTTLVFPASTYREGGKGRRSAAAGRAPLAMPTTSVPSSRARTAGLRALRCTCSASHPEARSALQGSARVSVQSRIRLRRAKRH